MMCDGRKGGGFREIYRYNWRYKPMIDVVLDALNVRPFMS